MKDPSGIVKVCDKIIKISLYALVFLMPVFFLPWSGDIVEFNKQTLLLFLTFIPLFAWMLKVLVSGSFSLSLNNIHIAGATLFLVYGASTLFSVARQDSFWGASPGIHESLISLLCLLIFCFLISNVFTEKEMLHSLFLFTISSCITLAYAILQIFGLHVIPLSFAKRLDFTTLGTRGSLGVFAALVLPLCMVLAAFVEKWWKVLCIAICAMVLVISVASFSFIWWVVLAVSIIAIIFWILRKDVFEPAWVALPMFFLVVSLFFLTFSPQIKWIPQNPLEVYISHKTNAQIDIEAIKTSPIFGSGPGTFVYDFAKHKDREFNKSSFWDINFNTGSSKVLTDIATLGILGALAMLAFFLIPIIYGVKFLLRAKLTPSSKRAIPLVAALVAGLAGQLLGYFFYGSNLTLHFLTFFYIGMLAVIITKHQGGEAGLGEGEKTYVLKSSSLLNLALTFVFTAAFIFGLGFLMLGGQRYIADMYYAKSFRAFSANEKISALTFMKKAVANNSKSDTYLRQLAVFSVLTLRDEAVINKDTAQAKRLIEMLVSDAVNASNAATSLNPKNFENWAAQAYTCQNLIGVAGDALDCAIKAYDQALKLHPNSPYFYLEKGNTYFVQAVTEENISASEKNALFAKAQEAYAKAIELKEDYSLAYFRMGLVAGQQDNMSAQRTAFQNAAKHSPKDAGLALLMGITYYQDGNWSLAQAEFTRALTIAPDYANALYYAGLTYDKQGQKEKAIEAFARLSTLNPDNENVRRVLNNLRAGKPALEGLVPQPPAPVPSTDSSEITPR